MKILKKIENLKNKISLKKSKKVALIIIFVILLLLLMILKITGESNKVESKSNVNIIEIIGEDKGKIQIEEKQLDEIDEKESIRPLISNLSNKEDKIVKVDNVENKNINSSIDNPISNNLLEENVDKEENKNENAVEMQENINDDNIEAYITGKIVTENFEGKHISKIIVYKTSDTREENDQLDPREVIAEVTTREDGNFIIKVEEIEEYDIVVIKDGYLRYRVLGIEVVNGEKTILDQYSLIAGDVIETGEIKIDDLADLNYNIGIVITEENKEEKGIYDLNEDGIIDKLDTDIIKKNYGKLAQSIEWIKMTI